MYSGYQIIYLKALESEMKRRIVRSSQTNKGELKMDNIKQVIALVLIVLLSMLGTAPL